MRRSNDSVISEEGYVVRVGLEAGLTGVTHYSIVKTAPRGAVISLSISQDTNIIYALSNSWVIKIPTSLEDACQHAATCRLVALTSRVILIHNATHLTITNSS